MTAGHNALRGSGPVKRTHSTMLWPMWVVLIAGSTGSALRAVRPPNLHITPVARCDLVQAASAHFADCERRSGQRRTDAGYIVQPPARLAGSMPSPDHPVELQDLN